MSRLDGPLVLVVDDDDDLRELIELALDAIGLRYVSASNGREALAVAAERNPAVILLDMRMPVMDGRSFALELRSRPGPRIPIVVMSAAEDVEACARTIGAEEHIAKPFEIRALAAKLRHALELPVERMIATSLG